MTTVPCPPSQHLNVSRSRQLGRLGHPGFMAGVGHWDCLQGGADLFLNCESGQSPGTENDASHLVDSMPAPLPTALDRTGQDRMGRRSWPGLGHCLLWFHVTWWPLPVSPIAICHLQNPLMPDSAERHQAEATPVEMEHFGDRQVLSRALPWCARPRRVFLRRSRCRPAPGCCHSSAPGNSASWHGEVRLLDTEAGTGTASPGTTSHGPGAPLAGPDLSRPCSSAAFPGQSGPETISWGLQLPSCSWASCASPGLWAGLGGAHVRPLSAPAAP